MDEIMIAWAAGIYEGEGHTEKGHPVRITQKDTWILYKLMSLYGGNIIPHGNGCSNWSLDGPSGRELLKLFIPYLSPRRIKQIEDSGVFDVLIGKNTCQKGHEFTTSNTQWLPNGYRKCRLCRKIAGY